MSANLSFLKLSTDDFPERNRVEAFRELYGKSIIKVDLEPLPGGPFCFDTTLYALPNLKLAKGQLSPVIGRLTKELVQGDDLLFSVTLKGGRTLHQRGSDARLESGEAGLTTSIDPGVVTVDAPSQFLSMRVPRQILQPMVRDIDACLLRPIPSGNEALRLLIGYSRLLDETRISETPEVASVVATHIHDLIAVALGANRDHGKVAFERGVPAARLRAIKDDILGNLARTDLSINAVAKRHGISSRYVRMLFAGEQTSFTDFVLSNRLARACQMLQQSRYGGTSIANVAFACGFGDLSYFNRTFRRRYGATPSDLRERAQPESL